MSINWVDILFLITVVLLVFQGIQNGAILSLINLLSIPIALGAAFFFGPRFTALLMNNSLPATPLIAYIVLFFGIVFILHILARFLHGIVKSIPLIGQGDALVGGAIGFVETWLLWLFLLIVLGSFLNGLQSSVAYVPGGTSSFSGANVDLSHLHAWHDLYNQTIQSSLFAQVNSLFVKVLPNVPQPPR